MTVSDLIEQAGGTRKLAEKLGSSPNAVCNWRFQGVPYKHHARLRAMLSRRVGRLALAEALEWRPSK